MKMVKSLLLGSAAALVAVAGAQAADLPVKAKPVQYVKICSLYGAGFYYIPGTDTCIKVGGYFRAEDNFNAGGSFSVANSGNVGNWNDKFAQTWRTRSGISADVRSQTEYGTLRGYVFMAATSTNSNAGAPLGGGASGNGIGNYSSLGGMPYDQLYSPAAFIQFAGFTAGKTASFFDFDLQPYSNQSNYWGSNQAGNGVDLFAYTAQIGNGLSASIAAENPSGHRFDVFATGGATTVTVTSSVPAIAAVISSYSSWQYANQQVPDIVGNLRVDQAWGGAQLMGAYHQLDLMSSTAATGTHIDSAGYAVGAGLKVNLPMIGAGDNAIVQVAYAEGATSYIASGMNGGLAVLNSGGTTEGFGIESDGVVDPTGGLHKTSGWSVTGGYEHHWNTNWKSSLYGAYGQLKYDTVASGIIAADAAITVGAGNPSANWNFGQVGTRTVWTPVENLDLSVEVMYNSLNTGFAGATAGAATASNESWFSGIFRVQRNFWP